MAPPAVFVRVGGKTPALEPALPQEGTCRCLTPRLLRLELAGFTSSAWAGDVSEATERTVVTVGPPSHIPTHVPELCEYQR